MKEIWKDVIGYEDSYEVSNYGQIKSKYRLVERFNYKANRMVYFPYKSKVLKQRIGRGNYYIVNLCLNGIKKCYYVHRLVITSFTPNPENKSQINHIDGNKHNNNIDNLEWVTDSENKQHCRKNNLQRTAKGTDFKRAKLNDEKIREIFNLYKNGLSVYKIAKYYGYVSPSMISAILRRERWKHVEI